MIKYHKVLFKIKINLKKDTKLIYQHHRYKIKLLPQIFLIKESNMKIKKIIYIILNLKIILLRYKAYKNKLNKIRYLFYKISVKSFLKLIIRII
jgi:hypothetical protein